MVATRSMMTALLVCISSASGAAPAGAPAPAGADIDPRSAWAVADVIVSGEVTDVDADRSMHAFDGAYAAARLAVAKRYKGDAAGPLEVWLSAPPQAHADVTVPAKGAASVFYLWAENSDRLRVFKAVPATPELLGQLQDLAARPASRPAEKPQEAEKLTATIVFHKPARAEQGTVSAAMRLTNEGRGPVRVCTRGGMMNTMFTPGSYKSDTPPMYDFARYVVELAPGKSVDIPIPMPAGGRNPPDRLTASYSVSEVVATKLDIWAGTVTAPAVDRPAQP